MNNKASVTLQSPMDSEAVTIASGATVETFKAFSDGSISLLVSVDENVTMCIQLTDFGKLSQIFQEHENMQQQYYRDVTKRCLK